MSGGERHGGGEDDVRDVNVERRREVMGLSHVCFFNPETPANMASPALYYQICRHGKEYALWFIFYRLIYEATVV